MLNLFRRRKRDAAKVAVVPEGERIYAIGDVHGRLDLLIELLGAIAADATEASERGERCTLVTLGDYVDRGPNSAQVVDMLMRLKPSWAQIVCLRGNHEQVMLDVLSGDLNLPLFDNWLAYGGRETLTSYGMAAADVYSDQLTEMAMKARKIVPPAHLAWMQGLPLSWRRGDYLFAHAGVRPNVPLDEQKAQDLLWIREPFLNAREDFGAVVIHGHSISPDVEERPNRIGIDTGAYASGVLTALVLLPDGSRRYVDTGVHDTPGVEPAAAQPATV